MVKDTRLRRYRMLHLFIHGEWPCGLKPETLTATVPDPDPNSQGILTTLLGAAKRPPYPVVSCAVLTRARSSPSGYGGRVPRGCNPHKEDVSRFDSFLKYKKALNGSTKAKATAASGDAAAATTDAVDDNAGVVAKVVRKRKAKKDNGGFVMKQNHLDAVLAMLDVICTELDL